ncbi:MULTISPECIES: hypothetical protein [unclassified Bradyrhizobium]|uniref:hypothetical protein n=1 Tax=unclassified Bradyrhizobium TaxID=2631580 RepID=UPI0028E67A8D|nr:MULTISPECIES: hypothetical protein [unclassified Bradyrhizobium]
MTRRLMAALVALVLSLAPLLGTFEVATADTGAGAPQWSRTTTSAPKPCRKAVLPGMINTCPFAAAGLTAVPANDNPAAQPVAASRTLSWRPYDEALTTQCYGSSPYRPPCRHA